MATFRGTQPSNLTDIQADPAAYTDSTQRPAGTPGTQGVTYVAPQNMGGSRDSPETTARINQTRLLNAYDASGNLIAPQSTAAQSSAAQSAAAGQASYTPYTSEMAPGAQQAQYSAYSPQTAGEAQQAELTRLGQASLVRAPNIGFQQSNGVDLGPTQTAGYTDVARTGLASVGSVAQPMKLGFTYAPTAADVSASQLNPAKTAFATDANQAVIGPMEQAQAIQAQQANYNTADSDAMRARQMQLLDYLQKSAEGTNGPSAAEMQFQRNLDKAIAAQHAQAAGAVGTGRVSANLQSGYNIGELSQDANAQSAMLRAQEQQQARSDLLAGLNSTRGQDLTVAGQRAQLEQGVNLQNAALGTQTNQFNAGQTNQGLQQQAQMATAVNMANAQLQTATAQFNAGQINQQQLAQAQLNQQAALANMEKQASNNQFNAGLNQQRLITDANLSQQAGIANAGFITQGGLANQAVEAQRNSQQAAIDANRLQFNAAQGNQFTLQQGQMDLSNNQFNSGQFNDIQKAQAALGLQAGTFNAGAQNAFTQQQAGLNSQERLSNAAAANQMSQFNVGQTNAAGMQNNALQNANSQFNAGQVNANNQFNVGQANSVGTFNAGQQNSLSQFNTGQTNQTNQFNAGLQNSSNISNAGLQNQVNIQNSANQLQQQQIDDARKKALMDQYLTGQGQLLGQQQSQAQIDAAKRGQNLQLLGGGIGAGATGLAALFSDERVKTDVKPLYSDEGTKTKKHLLDHYDSGIPLGGDDEVSALLDNLHAYRFKYKDPEALGAPKGERYGIMAQDLEKSPMGASIVINDGGPKKIDPAQAVGVILAAMARMNQKLKKVERR